MSENSTTPDVDTLSEWIGELGFQLLGIADTRRFDRLESLQAWVAQGFHGEMDYMARDAQKRARPDVLVPGTVSALVVSLGYAPDNPHWVEQGWQQLASPGAAYVSLYARGRDYHKLVRNRLQKLADRLVETIGPFGYRAFCDSAPVMEVALAERAGLGWRGKHTLLLNREHGSMFFLGALLTDLPLTPSLPAAGPMVQTPGQSDPDPHGHCGSCRRCIDICPTRAIVAPYQLDARRCISYLTIELKGSIPEPLRPLIGNRVYGCDDCQLVCPWNKFAQPGDADFAPRHGLDTAGLVELFGWSAEQFDLHTRGSSIRRIGHERWLRNIAVGLGNACAQAGHLGRAALDDVLVALRNREHDDSALVREHVAWALAQVPGEPSG